MRFVLNSLEHYCWQDAFLSSELESIYRHSHVVHTLLTTGWQNPNDQCTICFRELRDRIFRTTHVTCGQCGRAAHKDCVGAVKRVRQPIQDGQCYTCEDRAERGVEKFSVQRKARPAVPVNTAVIPAVTQPARQVGQQSFQTIFKDEDRGSPSRGDVGDEQLDNKIRSTSPCSSSDVSSISSLSDLSSPSQLFVKKEATCHPHYQQPRRQLPLQNIAEHQSRVDSRNWTPPCVPQTQPVRPKASNVPMSASVPQSYTPVPLPAIAFAWKEQKQKKQQQQQQHTQVSTQKSTLFLPPDISLQTKSPVSVRFEPIIEDEARCSADASYPAAPASASPSPISDTRPAAGSFANNGTSATGISPSTIRTKIQNRHRKVAELKQIFERLAKESKQELKAIKKQHKQGLKEKRKIKKKAKRELKKLIRKGEKLQRRAEAGPKHTERSSAD